MNRAFGVLKSIGSIVLERILRSVLVLSEEVSSVMFSVTGV